MGSDSNIPFSLGGSTESPEPPLDPPQKEKQKLKHFLDETDKLRDYTETDIANRRVEKIVGKLSDLISQAKEMKIDHDVSAQSVRQWQKDEKATYVPYFLWRKKSLHSS